MDRFVCLLLPLFINGVHSISINSSLLLVEEDFPLHSDLPILLCPKSIRLLEGDPSGVFSLHPLSNSSCATLRLNSHLDADIRASDGSFLSYSLVFGESSRARLSLDIQVIDVNDNEPTLIDPPAIVKIPQGAKRGSLVTTFTSFDADSGIFGLPRYSILPKQRGVSIRRGSSDGKGRSKAELILEEGVNERMSLTLLVQDGEPSRGISHSTTWNFTLIPSDANVNTAPSFSSIVSQSILIPDVPIGSTVFSLREDSDDARRVYAIEDNALLRIDNKSGEVVLIKRPQNKDEISFRVKVTDPSSHLFTEATLRVVFKSLPSSPSNSSLLHPSYNFSIQEETMSHLPIAVLPVGVSLSISSLPPSLPLIVEGGNLRVARIDRDTLADSLLSFNIQAVDEAGGSMGESVVFLSIEDINDHAPIFSQSNYTFGLTKEGAERKSGGVFIGRIVVEDSDATAPFNTLSVYTRDARLRVERDGSVFTTKQITDEEIVVRIFASDGGSPNKTASTLVQVRLIEEERITVVPGQKLIDWSGSGDESKRYSLIKMESPRYSVEEVKEWIEINHTNGSLLLLTPIPSPLIRLFVLVKEERNESPKSLLLLFPHNNVLALTEKEYTVFVLGKTNESIIDISIVTRGDNVTFSLEGFPSPPPLAIDDKGRVYWKDTDEDPPSDWLNGSVVVRDGEGRQDRAAINFLFTTTNLHIPQFASASFVVFLSLPFPRGKLLPLPSPPAMDLDPHDTLQYSIVDISGFFSVNSSTGRIKVIKEIKEEEVFEFSLVVKDNGGRTPFHQESIKVRVEARSEGDSIGMETSVQSLSLPADASPGILVAKLNYTGRVKLVSTDRHFSVNERRELILSEKIDAFANEKICGHLQSDGALPIPFCVNIIDHHSLPVVQFPSEGSIVSAEEGRMNDQVVELRLAPSSPPSSFRLLNETHSEWDWLSLSPTGILSTLRPLDYEKRPSILVRIGVCSLAGECSPLSFTINVIDKNDFCPVFENTWMEVWTDEKESHFPLKIATIPEAKDGDTSPHNRNNCYSIDSPLFFFDSPSFSSSPSSPSSLYIYTNTSFDHSITPVIFFNVLSFDCNLNCNSSTGHFNSTLAITLQIRIVNKNFPRFSSRVRHLTVMGGSSVPAGTQMALFTASDGDVSEKLEYSIKGSIKTDTRMILPSDAPFFVNSSTGQVISRSSLPSSSYSFTIQVNDIALHQDEMRVYITTISIDEQTEILFEIPFQTFLQREELITDLLSSGSSFTAVIDKCRQRANSTVVLLHFMDSTTVADIDKAIENLNRSPSPAVIELRSLHKMRLEGVRGDLDGSSLSRVISIAVIVLLFSFSFLILIIICRTKKGLSPSPPCLGVHAVKRSPYWTEISVPVVKKKACESLQSTEL
ncbi:hypothetical protein PMAYCL1PPCAC_18243 [Pristionchus mayeri]|uniref:Cadherin domain-containing protein n=1 Tax=Pristionchus mayeri TaxID=1317129 RepID=A0AAN5CP44_9BILA|nr:hypothetical protein PMAYCL1PPCAC_18243 [Pristionchus mayeri]